MGTDKYLAQLAKGNNVIGTQKNLHFKLLGSQV
jgi:hypothetical protein